jgi:glycine/D-amino acid oxidase-like deaminating enzyme
MKMVDLHLPMLRRPGLMVATKPVEPLLNHILAAPDQEFRQLPNGSILAPAAASHQSDDSEEVAEPIAMANIAIARLNRLIRGVDLELSEARMAFRPVPEDGFPAVGRVQDGLYVATMHSGMTLAAIMGNLIASEIADGVTNLSNDLLSSYRPNRFR